MTYLLSLFICIFARKRNIPGDTAHLCQASEESMSLLWQKQYAADSGLFPSLPHPLRRYLCPDGFFRVQPKAALARLMLAGLTVIP